MSCSNGTCTCGKNEHSHQQKASSNVLLASAGRMLSPEHLISQLTAIIPEDEIIQVRFKNNRKDYFRNSKRFNISKDDRVVVEVANGYDIGTISLTRNAAMNALNKSEMDADLANLPEILRSANVTDLENWLEARKVDSSLMHSCKILAEELNMTITLHNAECRADKKSANIYYSGQDPESCSQLQKGLMEWSGMEILLVQTV